MPNKRFQSLILWFQLCFSCLCIILPLGSLHAHFQELIPSADIVSQQPDSSSTDIPFSLNMRFTHPMENGPLMNMAKPQAFGVLVNGKKLDLLSKLESTLIGQKTVWYSDYAFKEPGDHVFYLSPSPYWEAAEDKLIIHHTKVVVDGFQGGEGWDQLVGLPVEIEPLSRPYGLWTHNIFRGRVLKNGKPVAFAPIEVEFRNDLGKVKIPSSPYITQIIKTDAHGVFSYGLPRAGWWGFSAITTAEKKLPNPDGVLKPVEEAALIWVYARDMK